MSKSMKGINAIEKVQLVEEYLSGNISRSTAIKKVGISESTFRLWLRLYRTSGPTALLPLKKNKYYSNELKIKVVKEYLSGNISKTTLCSKYNIHGKEVNDLKKVIYSN